MRSIFGRGSVDPDGVRTADAQLNGPTGSAAQGTGAVQIYFAVGACNQLVDSLQFSVQRLENHLNQQHNQGCIAIEHGPFAGDPDAAVAVAAESLRQARAASHDRQTALERAHMAVADIADPEPERRRRRC